MNYVGHQESKCPSHCDRNDAVKYEEVHRDSEEQHMKEKVVLSLVTLDQNYPNPFNPTTGSDIRCQRSVTYGSLCMTYWGVRSPCL